MRKTFFSCLAVALLCLGGFAVLVWPRHCPVNRAAFERVEEQRKKQWGAESDMPLGEVESILGMPPGD